MEDRGISLEEAFRQSLSKTELAEMEEYYPYRDGTNAPIMTGYRAPTHDFYDKYHEIRGPLEQRFKKEALLSGKLRAMGFKSPIEAGARRISIPTEQWEVLEPDFEDSSASGEGLKMVKIKMFVGSDACNDSSLNDSSLNDVEQSRALTDPKKSIHLTENNSTLTIGSEVFHFRGSLQPEIIRIMFEAYMAGKRLRTKDILYQARGGTWSGAGTQSMDTVFSKNKYWKKLKDMGLVAQENEEYFFKI
jgi:hypothetical protein